MRGEERLPGRLRAALRCRLNAVILEDRFDRVACDVVAEALQPAANARVAPGRIFDGHANDDRGDIRRRGRATGSPFLCTVVLRGDQSPIPPQDGVGCHDTSDGRELPTAEDLALYGQPTSLVIREAETSGTVCGAEDAILLQQVVNDRLLLPIDPAGEQQDEEGERGRQRVHRGSWPEAQPRFNKHETGPRALSRRVRFPRQKPLRRRRWASFPGIPRSAEYSHSTGRTAAATS